MPYFNQPFYRHSLFYHLIIISLLILFLQFFQDLLIFKHNEIVHGEYWRLLSANFVHTNYPHIGLNLLGLWILFFLFIDHFDPQLFYSQLIILSLSVGTGILFLSPETQWYAGLSGTLYGMFLAMALIATYRRDWWLGPSVTLLIISKLIIDEFDDTLSQSSSQLIEAPILTFSHVLGGISASIYCIILWLKQRFIT